MAADKDKKSSRKKSIDDQIKAAQDRAKAEFERAQEEKKREVLKRRISVANAGVQAFEDGKWAEASAHFHTYLQALEHWKKVPEGSLHPGLFDKKSDLTEILLISGVYWDLVKLYDRAPGREKQFQQYLNKYLTFSKGMPFQSLSAETMRKYLARDQAKHKSAMKAAYKQLNNSKCFIASELVDEIDPSVHERLWAWRDRCVENSWIGRISVQSYYFMSPAVAAVLARAPKPWRKKVARGIEVIAGQLPI